MQIFHALPPNNIYNSIFICSYLQNVIKVKIFKAISPITGMDRPRGFQEVKVPRFQNNGTGWW